MTGPRMGAGTPIGRIGEDRDKEQDTLRRQRDVKDLRRRQEEAIHRVLVARRSRLTFGIGHCRLAFQIWAALVRTAKAQQRKRMLVRKQQSVRLLDHDQREVSCITSFLFFEIRAGCHQSARAPHPRLAVCPHSQKPHPFQKPGVLI